MAADDAADGHAHAHADTGSAAAVAGTGPGGDRLAELVDAVVSALAGVVREHRVTEEEWYRALDLVGRAGRADEMVLLSDVQGLSVLVDRQGHAARSAGGATASNVRGPFWRAAPDIPNPGTLADPDDPGEPLVLSGVVTGAGGAPLAGARLDLWQCDGEGRYDVQVGTGEAVRYRGVLTTGDDGRYEVRTVVPPPYEVPTGGPVGELLAALGRHAHRPAHVHYRVAAPGHAELTTMVFFAGDPWLGDDAIGADLPELTVEVDRSGPVATARFDVRLAAAPAGPGG